MRLCFLIRLKYMQTAQTTQGPWVLPHLLVMGFLSPVNHSAQPPGQRLEAESGGIQGLQQQQQKRDGEQFLNSELLLEINPLRDHIGLGGHQLDSLAYNIISLFLRTAEFKTLQGKTCLQEKPSSKSLVFPESNLFLYQMYARPFSLSTDQG